MVSRVASGNTRSWRNGDTCGKREYEELEEWWHVWQAGIRGVGGMVARIGERRGVEMVIGESEREREGKSFRRNLVTGGAGSE
jgi:hypothetical protein